MRPRLKSLPILVCLVIFTCGAGRAETNRRPLRVVLYPFIPEYQTVKTEVKKGFEALHPDIDLQFVDLDGNYYAPGLEPQDEYIGATKADVYELDSVFLRDFVDQKKIQLWPGDALLPEDQLLKNAASGSKVDGARYGAAHWVCGNFIFFKSDDHGFTNLQKLSDLENAIGSPSHPSGTGIATDLKGKSTLGEFYLETAFDHYGGWQGAKPHLGAIDPALEADLERVVRLCDAGYCRSEQYHKKDPGIYARLFARQKARAFLGYSEGLYSALAESVNCKPSSDCLRDSQIDVVGFPSDDHGRYQMSWVDSYVLDADCNQQCAADAAEFVKYMNSDQVYKKILLHTGSVPTYLLPAKATLYSDKEVVATAHLYPKLKSLIEAAEAPSELGLNDELRKRGAELDGQLPGNEILTVRSSPSIGALLNPTPSLSASSSVTPKSPRKTMLAATAMDLRRLWPPDWSQFVPTVLGTLVGSLLGFGSALLLNRSAERKQEAHEVVARKRRHVSVLQLVQNELRRNHESLERIKADLDSGVATSHTVTLDTWEAVPQDIFDALLDSGSSQAVIESYERLREVRRDLSMYDSLITAGGDSLLVARENHLPRLIQSLNDAIVKVTNAATNIHEELARRSSS